MKARIFASAGSKRVTRNGVVREGVRTTCSVDRLLGQRIENLVGVKGLAQRILLRHAADGKRRSQSAAARLPCR